MNKGELESHARSYDDHDSAARGAFDAGDLSAAVGFAIKACELAEGRMRYQKKYQPASLDFAPSFNYACHAAALLLDPDPIATVAGIIDGSRWIRTNCADDASAVVDGGRERLLKLHGVWSHLAGCPYVEEGDVTARWGRDALVMEAVTNWVKWDILRTETNAAGKSLYVANGRTSDKVLAKCPACGVTTIVRADLFLELAACPKCKAAVNFTIVARAPFKKGD